MSYSAIGAGVYHRWHLGVASSEYLCPGPRLIVEIPVERRGQQQPLRCIEAQAVNIRDEHQQTSQTLAALGDAKFSALFDQVDHVTAGCRETDDLGLRCLRLQEIGREIGGVDRMAHAAEHATSGSLDNGLGVCLQRSADREIRGDEEPAVAAAFDYGATSA